MLKYKTDIESSVLPPAIFLMGPTASGKTDLAYKLVDSLPLEIISVDSALVYRGMDIGTAKPSMLERQQYPHYLVDIIDPIEAYSVAAFREDALAAMQDIQQRGKVPLLVGGTMLYFRALQYGLSALPAADPEIRELLEQRLEAEGLQALHAELAKIDPTAAHRIHENDPQRILRALEVYLSSGQTLSALFVKGSGQPLTSRVFKMALMPEQRSELHQRIASRFAAMLQQGLVDELSALRQRGGLHAKLPSMRLVGYRQVWQYLEGELEYEEMLERGIIATRQLAKRQLTWLRSEPDLKCLNMLRTQPEKLAEEIKRFML